MKSSLGIQGNGHRHLMLFLLFLFGFASREEVEGNVRDVQDGKTGCCPSESLVRAHRAGGTGQLQGF